MEPSDLAVEMTAQACPKLMQKGAFLNFYFYNLVIFTSKSLFICLNEIQK